MTCSTPSKPSLEPEALQLTRTAFADPKIPQAQNIVTGKGVTVAYLADGVDINNPDFIRRDGSHVFTSSKDFTGNGPDAPTGGSEAFGDASSIAAQGREVYNLNDWVAPVHRRAGCPLIRIRGMAPGASLMGLNIGGSFYDSTVIQAIQYAIDHGANVINESLGVVRLPDADMFPEKAANAAAIAHGVTVVAITGDSGSSPSTLWAPGTAKGVINVGATTQLRSYVQSSVSAAQLGRGYVSNNISAISSAGVSQSGRFTTDVVAPGDLGWAVCTADISRYSECTSAGGQPSSIELFGGTSESAPFVAGTAALVIQAYRQSHSGKTPPPGLVRQIIMGSATDLGAPAYEQGAGLLNSLGAVRVALSYGKPQNRQGEGLLLSPDDLVASPPPGRASSFAFRVTNTGRDPQTVTPRVIDMGSPFSGVSYQVSLDPATDATFTDGFGTTRAYVTKRFTVSKNADRLDASFSWDVQAQPSTLVRVTLFDPKGRITAFSAPQDRGYPVSNSGYGHLDVRAPLPGQWRAVVWTLQSGGYKGVVHLSLSESRWVTDGSVEPKQRTIASGSSGSFRVTVNGPKAPGDYVPQISIRGKTSHGASTQAGAIPIILRAVVPVGKNGAFFTGHLSGGNGRLQGMGPVLTYAFDVPKGHRDLELALAIPDDGYNLEGILVDPRGMPVDVQSTATALDANGLPSRYVKTMQFFRRAPAPGRWRFLLGVNDNIGGNTTAERFTGRITFDQVDVHTKGLPQSPSQKLTEGAATDATVTVKNTGNTTKDFFVDARLSRQAPLLLGSDTFVLPTQRAFFVVVPPASTKVVMRATSTSTSVPIQLEGDCENGAPPNGYMYGAAPAGTPYLDKSGNHAAQVVMKGPEVQFGRWAAWATEIGPYPGPAPATSVTYQVTATTRIFDDTFRSSTGDGWASVEDMGVEPYTPLRLDPGQSGTIHVSITPSATSGTTVHGSLYVDTLAITNNNLLTGSGDELVAIPYAYTVA